MGIGIVTGYTGEPHVTAMDDKIRNAAALGIKDLIFDVGEGFLLEKIDDTTIRVHSGSGVMQGVQYSIQPMDYEDVNISAGTAGFERHDLICVRYEKNNTTSVESITFVVYEGEPAPSGEAVPPYGSLTHGNILDGDLINETAFALIKISSTTTLYGYELLPEIFDAELIDAAVINTIWNEIWTGGE